MSGASEAQQAPRRAGPLAVAKTVLSGLIGVRRKADHESARVTPAQVVVAGLLLAAFFVFTLITIVRLVVG
jgi:Protein of unknown function (DUF2970)